VPSEPEQSPSGGGEWLPPVPPGPQPGPPPGWRISPRAVDLAPDAHMGPEPWADPGNSVAGVALGLAVAAFGVLFFRVVGIFALPLGIAAAVLGAIGRGRIKRGETRQGKVEVSIALTVGIATTVIVLLGVLVYIARH